MVPFCIFLDQFSPYLLCSHSTTPKCAKRPSSPNPLVAGHLSDLRLILQPQRPVHPVDLDRGMISEEITKPIKFKYRKRKFLCFLFFSWMRILVPFFPPWFAVETILESRKSSFPR